MKPNKLITLIIAAVLAMGAGYTADLAAASKTKARTGQTSKSKSSKKSKSGSKSSKSRSTKPSKSSKSGSKSRKASSKKSSRTKGSKKRGASSKKGSKRNRRGNVARNTYKAPPKEVPQNDSLTLAVNRAVLDWVPPQHNPGGLRVNSVKPDQATRSARVGLNENFTYLPVTKGMIDTLSRTVREAMPDSLRDYRVTLNVGQKPLAYYIRHIDKLPEKYRRNPAFVTEVHPDVVATRGMDRDIIALWHSHGRYYSGGGWAWQRPMLFETAEDVFTMSYIVPYLAPMLENAGAYVMLPRERDTNRHEVIIDNDTNPEGEIYSQPYYKEVSAQTKWSTGELEGFIYDLPDFRDTENPFENGTYRQTETRKGGKPSVAAWYADIPEEGEYAVYVSYKTLPNSTSDARYTVHYSGGSKEFKVNQQMGGGTWIYLGTFPFESGYSDVEPVVTLTNLTEGTAGTLVTADAVKIGGGMGNIARSSKRSDIYYDPSTPSGDLADDSGNTDDEEALEEEDDEETGDDESTVDDDGDDDGGDDIIDTAGNDQPEVKPEVKPETDKNLRKGPAPVFRTSGLPRWVEGARYWLQWAGYPEYVYSPYHGTTDYKDDYTSRGHWVNYLAGGSRVLPGREGLSIPVDAAFALHSDAGKRADDSTVGTLGIYFSQNGASYKDGTPRINSRMLTDMILQQITKDVRAEYEPRWTRRSMWDKSYVEARVPEVPTTLVELLSHQNYGDMVYGLDPNFRFTVGRAIYKGIARFMAERKERKLVIQPLPVNSFAIKRTKPSHYRLSWTPTPDKLEPTAMPDKYVVMERSGSDLGFHKIGETKSTHFDLKVADSDIHSFYIIAVNDGGKSFPSETLALREGPSADKPALVVNGFTRISAPGTFSQNGQAGFDSENDFGVPYIRDISFTGHQTEFRRSAGNAFGNSGSNFTAEVIAGNTFDFAALHGSALADAGLGFVSASAAAVEKGEVKLSDYPVVDLILGKQKNTAIGQGKRKGLYRAFPADLQKKLRGYLEKGGDLIVSGAYVASDILSDAGDEGRKFAREVLGVDSVSPYTAKGGRVRDVRSGKEIRYSSTLNKDRYIVERPDVIVPSEGVATEAILTFGNGSRAGQLTDRFKGQAAVLSIPIESITDSAARNSLVREILGLLRNK